MQINNLALSFEIYESLFIYEFKIYEIDESYEIWNFETSMNLNFLPLRDC